MDREAGFTLIELIIVIVIIGVLLTISAFTQSGVLAGARDAERADDTASIARLLEDSYTNQSAGSPSYPDETTFVSDATNHTGTAAASDASIFRTPNSSTVGLVGATSTSTQNPYGANSPTTGQYVYQALTSANTLCTSHSQTCVLYRLFYRKEAGGSVVTLMSVHQQ